MGRAGSPGSDRELREAGIPRQIRRGEIRWFRFSKPQKRRPVLVLGRAESLSSLSQIPVVPLSGQIRGLAWEVRLSSEDGMAVDCVLKPEWIQAVDRAELGALIANLSEDRWPEVRQALLQALGFE